MLGCFKGITVRRTKTGQKGNGRLWSTRQLRRGRGPRATNVPELWWEPNLTSFFVPGKSYSSATPKILPVPLLFQRGWETGIKQRQDKSYSCRFPSSAKSGTDWKAPKKAWSLPARPGGFWSLIRKEQGCEGQAWKAAGTAFGAVFLFCGFLPGMKRGRVKYAAFFKQGWRSPSLAYSADKGQEPGSRANGIAWDISRR